MKKIWLLAAVLSASVVPGMAQEFYAKLGFGYAFPQAGQSMDGTGQPYNGSLNSNTYSIKGASFSAGTHGTIGFGYMFNNHIGIELDGDWGLSTKKYTYTDYGISYGGVLSNADVIQQASVFNLIPSLVLQTGGKTWNIYSRVGLALPLNTQITEDQVLTNAAGTGALTVDDFTFNIKNSFTLGFAAAAGVQYKVTDRLCIWGEISMLSMAPYIKQSQLTGFSENGVSYQLSSVSGPQTVKYSKSTTLDTTYSTEAAYSQPFSNMGISVGVHYTISKNTNSRNSRNDDDLIDRPKNGSFKRRAD